MAHRHPGLKDNRDAGEQAFLAGILSLLGSIYDIPLDEILANLSLSEAVKDALTIRSGALGDLLKLSEQLEQMDSRLEAELARGNRPLPGRRAAGPGEGLRLARAGCFR